MTTELDNSSAVNESTVSGDASFSSPAVAPPEKPVKRKRNLAGMPGNILIQYCLMMICLWFW